MASDKIAVNMLRVVCILAPFVWVIAVPPLQAGVYGQIGMTSAALHALSSVALIGLGILVYLRERRTCLAVCHPVVLSGVAVAAWTAAVAIFLPDPALSFGGAPVHGVGVVWWLETTILLAACLRVGRVSAYTMVASCLVLLVINGFLYQGSMGHPGLLPPRYIDDHEWTRLALPYSWLEYMGFAGLFAAVALVPMRGNRRLDIAAVTLLAVCCFESGNKTAIVALLLVLALIAVSGRLRRGTPSRRLAFIVPVLVVACAGIVIAGCGRPLERMTSEVSGPQDHGTVPTDGPVDRLDIYSQPWGTLWSRSMMWRVSIESMHQDPRRLIVGRGWGAFPDIVEENSRSVGGRMFAEPVRSSALTVWDAHLKANFHSHNLFLESLNSGGIPGLILVFTFLCAFPVWAPRRTRMRATLLAIGIAVVGSFWFMPNTLGPFLAAAVAAVSSTSASWHWTTRSHLLARLLPSSVLIVSGVAGAAIAIASVHEARVEQRALLAITREAGGELPPGECSALGNFLTSKVATTAKLYVIAGAAVGRSMKPAMELRAITPVIKHLACATRSVMAGHPSADALSMVFRARSHVLASGPPPALVDKAIGGEIRAWPTDVANMLEIAPGRTDVLAYWIEWAVGTGHLDIAMRIASLAPRLSSGDPVRAWLDARGAMLRGDTGANELVVTALSRGIASIIPLPYEIHRR